MRAFRASMCACLLSCLAACSSTVVTRYEQVYIPDSLLAACPDVEWKGGTYRELGQLAAMRKKRIEECDARTAAARKYQDDLRAQEAGGKGL